MLHIYLVFSWPTMGMRNYLEFFRLFFLVHRKVKNTSLIYFSCLFGEET